MRTVRNHNWRRNSVPADRHKRAVACRHFPYHKPLKSAYKPESVSDRVILTEIETGPADGTFSEAAVSEMVLRSVPERKKKHRFHPIAAIVNHRKKVQAARNAEIDALISRKKYSLLQLIVSPYACMKNEALQELPSSALSSLFRMIVRWLVAAVLISCYFSSLINRFDFSILRAGFTDTADTAMRLTLMFVICEMIFYLVVAFASRFSKKPLSLGRLMAVGTMNWAAEIVGYLLAAIVGIEYPMAAFAMMIGTAVFGTVLRNKAIMECSTVRAETIAILTGLWVMISAVVIYYWFGLTERALIELLLAIYR